MNLEELEIECAKTDKILKWCGFKWTVEDTDGWHNEFWAYPKTNIYFDRDDMGLDFFFEFVVPKLVREGYSIGLETVLAEVPWYWWMIDGDDFTQWKADGANPAEVFKRALLDLIEEEYNDSSN